MKLIYALFVLLLVSLAAGTQDETVLAVPAASNIFSIAPVDGEYLTGPVIENYSEILGNGSFLEYKYGLKHELVDLGTGKQSYGTVAIINELYFSRVNETNEFMSYLITDYGPLNVSRLKIADKDMLIAFNTSNTKVEVLIRYNSTTILQILYNAAGFENLRKRLKLN